jgi:hypothetical protein
MPVRGTTAWRHAIVMKKVINRDEGGWGNPTSSGTHYVLCAYSACEKDGYEMYKVRVATHADGYEERYMNYVFCSQSHKEAWLDEWRHTKHLAEL